MRWQVVIAVGLSLTCHKGLAGNVDTDRPGHAAAKSLEQRECALEEVIPDLHKGCQGTFTAQARSTGLRSLVALSLAASCLFIYTKQLTTWWIRSNPIVFTDSWSNPSVGLHAVAWNGA